MTTNCILIVYTYEPDNATPPLFVGIVVVTGRERGGKRWTGPTQRGGLAFTGSYVYTIRIQVVVINCTRVDKQKALGYTVVDSWVVKQRTYYLVPE